MPDLDAQVVGDREARRSQVPQRVFLGEVHIALDALQGVPERKPAPANRIPPASHLQVVYQPSAAQARGSECDQLAARNRRLQVLALA